MSQQLLEDYVAELRRAASSDTPSHAIRAVLKESQAHQAALAETIAALQEDEVMMFEDETCSIWTCRYASDVVLAPHEHRMGVHIAVYRGTEVEVLYKREPGRLRHGGNTLVKQGDVVRLGPDAIHAITSDGHEQSIAIHVYEGPLTQVERSLFDWTTGAEVDFTMENFHAMARRKEDMAEFGS
jgi:predicted metal-dependent enzyme (double-stranded beta helix superfamily)